MCHEAVAHGRDIEAKAFVDGVERLLGVVAFPRLFALCDVLDRKLDLSETLDAHELAENLREPFVAESDVRVCVPADLVVVHVG